MKKYIHPGFRKRRNRIGIYCVTIAAIIGFHILQNQIIPDWLWIAATVFYIVGIFLLLIPDKK